jgi:tetratricopeptide (TPR) repeat protein
MMLSESFLNKKIIPIIFLAAILAGCSPYVRKPEPASKVYDSKAVELFVEATIAEEVDDYYRAIVLYQEALRRDSTSVTIHLALASAHQHLGQTESVLEHLNAASRLAPQDTSIVEWIVELLGNEDKWQEQKPYVERLLKLVPNSLTYNLQLANVYLQTGDRKSAQRVFRKVITLADDNKSTLQRLGVMLLLNNENELAERCFYKVCELDPVDDQAQFTLGRIYLALEKDREAQRRLEMAIAINDTVLRYWTNLAFIDLDADRNREAELILRRALEVLPDNPPLLNMLGSSLERQGQYDEALDVLYRSASLDTASVAPYVTIGFIYDESDQFEKAESTYVRALEIAPDNATLLNNYAYLLAARGLQLDRALEMSERSLEQTPDNPSYLDTIGWIYFRKGDPDRALEYLLKAKGLSEDIGSDLLDHLGDVYWAMKDHDKARDYWKQALKAKPDDETVKAKLRQPVSAQN